MTVKSTFSFTKLVVGDLEKSAAFYTEVCGLVEQARVEADVNGDPISEILFDPPYPGGPTFVLFKFLKRPAPTPGETILGFITPDVVQNAEQSFAMLVRGEDRFGHFTLFDKPAAAEGAAMAEARVRIIDQVYGNLMRQ